jgi:hypothetical protein
MSPEERRLIARMRADMHEVACAVLGTSTMSLGELQARLLRVDRTLQQFDPPDPEPAFTQEILDELSLELFL